jgi:hyperosmotically inducible protein
LQFEVQPDGVVTFKGEVTQPRLKSDAENVVKRIEGVESVINQIEVLPRSPNDDRIRRAVYQAIFNFNSPLFRYAVAATPSIHIIVENGNVTLNGDEVFDRV